MDILVGYTGFVGSNINKNKHFDGLYNSKNVKEAYGTSPDLLVYSGLRAEKYLANNDPEADMENIKGAIKNIEKIAPKKLVLISTIDVYKTPVGVDENTPVDTDGLLPYGLNRYRLEQWVEENIDDRLIIRLPGLYGINLKKNFIYDMIKFIPFMLKEEKFQELRKKDSSINDFYEDQNNGFYKCRELSAKERVFLRGRFEALGFSALNFTDSRGKYQFYNLDYFCRHINTAIQHGIKKLNMAVEGVTAAEVYSVIKHGEFVNELSGNVPNYDFKTIYADIFGGSNGYIFDKNFVLEDIKKFIGGNIINA